MKKIQIPSIDDVFWRIKKCIDKRDVSCFKIAIIFCCIGYFPFLSAWLGNPDSFRNGIIYKNGSDWENRQGDFGLTFFYKIKSYFISPALSTIGALIMLALICVLLRRCFEITKKWQICLMICFIAFCPNVCSTLTYYYCSDSYLLAYLLNVVAFYLLVKDSTVRNWVSAVCLIAFSLSCNQAYISVFAILLLLFSLDQLLKGNEISAVVRRGLRGALAGIFSMIVYIMIFNVLQKIMGFTADKSPFVLMPKQIIGLTKNTYLYCLSYYFKNDFLYNEWYGRKWWNLTFVLCFIVFLILYLLRRKPDVFRCLAILGCIALLPPALMLMTIIAPSPELLNTASMQMPAMNYMYLLPILVLNACFLMDKNEFFINGAEWILAYISLRIAVMWIVFVVAFEGYMQLNLNRMMTAVVDIEKQIDTITAMNGMKSGEMKVMFVGELPNVSYHNMLIDAVGGTMAEFKMAWNNEEGRQRSWSGFMKHSVGKSYETVQGEIYQEIIEKSEFQEMPVFPVNGYVKEFDDIIVIKLGENY